MDHEMILKELNTIRERIGIHDEQLIQQFLLLRIAVAVEAMNQGRQQ